MYKWNCIAVWSPCLIYERHARCDELHVEVSEKTAPDPSLQSAVIGATFLMNQIHAVTRTESTMSFFFRCLLILLLPILPACTTASSESGRSGQVERPNIVILFADDLGYGDLSSYGHPTISTPNLDRMADEGIRLTSFYAAAPVCSASRAALMTGRYAVRTGITGALMPESPNGLKASEITLAEALKEQGYRTMAIGKWHLGYTRPEYLPTNSGFDHFYGLYYSNDMIRPWVETDAPLNLYRDITAIEHPVDQATLTERYTDEAVRFIQESAGEPFFLYLAYTMPHLPIHASEWFRGTSRAGLYGDVVETIDWSAGRILETIRDLGLDEQTIVIFTSDNGPWSNAPPRMMAGGVKAWDTGSAGPLRDAKGTTYEGGVRVPGIFRWPGRIPPGRTSAEIATTMDLFPTLLNAAGAEIPADRQIDGNDLMPFLAGQTETSPTRTFYYFAGNNLQGVREANWKLRHSEEGPELFDLEIDPGERFNVAAEYPEVVARLDSLMKAFSESLQP